MPIDLDNVMALEELLLELTQYFQALGEIQVPADLPEGHNGS